jgi:hypothetical protein
MPIQKRRKLGNANTKTPKKICISAINILPVTMSITMFLVR